MNDIDPLALVKQYLLDKKIDERTYELIIDKMRVVEEGIKRIERKTSIDYPNYFIEPNLMIATSDIEYQQYSAHAMPGRSYNLSIRYQLNYKSK